MNGSKKTLTLQILLYQTQAPSEGRKIVRDTDLKPVNRTPIQKPYAAKRRAEAKYVNVYVPYATKRAGAKGGFILKTLPVGVQELGCILRPYRR